MLTDKTLKRINERPRQVNRRPLALIGTLSLAVAALLFVLVSSLVLALAALLAGAMGVLLAYRAQKTKMTIPLSYDNLDEETAVRFAAVQGALEALASSERIWRLTGQRDQDPKPDSIATMVTDRRRVEVGRLETPGISAGVAIWGIADEGLKVLFFPEGILLYQHDRYRGMSYKAFEVAFSSARFIEEEEVPEDAKVAGHTWRYTREDGSKDRRYTPNPRLPVILYGLLGITGSSGLDMRLQVSHTDATARFARAFGVEAPREEASGAEGQEEARRPAQEAENGWAYEVLGVAAGASMGEVTAAYRALARVHHPDKVAHLAPESREAEDHKMKEINAAYAELKRRKDNRGYQ